MMYGLRNKDIEKVNSIFANYPKITKAILYGSRAMGNYQKSSDIDISLVGDGLSLDILLEIETKLDDLLLPYEFDVSIFSRIENQDLVGHIKRVGEKFYEKKE